MPTVGLLFQERIHNVGLLFQDENSYCRFIIHERLLIVSLLFQNRIHIVGLAFQDRLVVY